MEFDKWQGTMHDLKISKTPRGCPFVACYKFDLDFVFKVTRIKENFTKLKLSGTRCDLWVWKIFIIIVDTLENYPAHINKISLTSCQGHSSNRLLQQTFSMEIKGITCTLNSYSFNVIGTTITKLEIYRHLYSYSSSCSDIRSV